MIVWRRSRRVGVSYLGLGVVVAVALAACSPNELTTGEASQSETTPAQGGSTLVTTADGSVPASSVTDSTVTDDSSTPNSSDGVDAPAGAGVPAPAGSIKWSQRSDAIDEGWLDVPVDYDKPNGEKFSLYVVRYSKTDPDKRIGSLLVNPGGPGFGGSRLALYADTTFDKELLSRFDVVAWDPRGTGKSTPAIDCIDDYDRYFTAVDGTPENSSDRKQLVDLSKEFAEQCKKNNASYLSAVGTNNSARDIDQIRQALGEDKISYFGFSYGSELGGTWATLFPKTVRAAVLDGATDPNADSKEAYRQQMLGFEASVEAFLSECKANGCAFSRGIDPLVAYSELMRELDENPLTVDSGRPPVNRDVAIGAVFEAMYDEVLWPALDRSLRAAQDGDGSGLLALFDLYYQRNADGTNSNVLEAFQVIRCGDTSARETVAESDSIADELHLVAPLLVPSGQVGSYWCNFFPASTDPRIDITGAGAGPILVIGTTGDPSTPLESTRAMAEALDEGTMITVTGNKHTGYGLNRCIVDAVNDYLIDLSLPKPDTVCS